MSKELSPLAFVTDSKNSWTLLDGFCDVSQTEDMIIQAIIWRSRGSQSIRSVNVNLTNSTESATYERLSDKSIFIAIVNDSFQFKQRRREGFQEVFGKQHQMQRCMVVLGAFCRTLFTSMPSQTCQNL